MSVHILTLAYYESTFCVGELGAVWISNKAHVPVLAPPVDYATLDGVQLGEQALTINRPRDLDELRDRVRDIVGDRGDSTALVMVAQIVVEPEGGLGFRV